MSETMTIEFGKKHIHHSHEQINCCIHNDDFSVFCLYFICNSNSQRNSWALYEEKIDNNNCLASNLTLPAAQQRLIKVFEQIQKTCG